MRGRTYGDGDLWNIKKICGQSSKNETTDKIKNYKHYETNKKFTVL